MALLLPVFAYLLGLAIIELTDEYNARRSAIACIFFTALFGPVACLLYGAFSWLRSGTWGAITIANLFEFAQSHGANVHYFLEPSSWVGIEKLSAAYVESNVAWSLFVVPLAIVLSRAD